MYNSLPFTFILCFIKNLSPMYTSGLSEASSSVSKSMFPCVSCNTKCAWRIKLRAAEIEMDSDNNEEVCGHLICISCMLAHLQEGIDAKKPRIKCPSKNCRKRLHENDIRALLDPENNDLDMFMERSSRKQLLYKHDVQTIEYAFGDSKNCVRNCPRCKNIYATKIGCNYVRCPNLGCNTWFCWECGEKDITWGHYVFDKCNPQWDDVLKGLYFISFLLFTGGFTLFYISLPVYLGLCGYFPLVVTFGTPIMILGRLRRQWIKRRCPQADRIRETKMLNWKQALLYWTLVTILYILLLPLGSIVGLMAFGFSLILLAIFLIVLFIKLIPIVGQVVCILEIIQCITGCFGYGEWLHWYRKSKEKKDNEHIANRQFKMQVRERLMNPNVGR